MFCLGSGGFQMRPDLVAVLRAERVVPPFSRLPQLSPAPRTPSQQDRTGAGGSPTSAVGRGRL